MTENVSFLQLQSHGVLLPPSQDSLPTWVDHLHRWPHLLLLLQGQPELVRNFLLYMYTVILLSQINAAPPTAPPTSGSTTDAGVYQPTSGTSALPPPPAPWQQAPPAAPPQGQAPGWQQPMMYGNVPAPLPMGGAAPPLPPGAPGAPPPPPPEQNWVRVNNYHNSLTHFIPLACSLSIQVGAPPPPPPPPPGESSS